MDNANLIIASFNARGISTNHRVAEIIAFAESTKPHIICVQETFLNHQTSCFVPNYTCIRADRPSHGGGLATLIKRGVDFAVSANQLQLVSGEFLAVDIKTRGRSITVANIYFPRNSPSITADFEAILSLNATIACGDWNAKHPLWSRGSNALGTKLANLLPRNNFSIHAPTDPTHWAPSGRSSTIDFAIANIPVPIVTWTTDQLQSDHAGVVYTITGRPHKVTKQKRMYQSANWPIFERVVSEELGNLQHETPEQIDVACSRFSEAIIKAHDVAVPLMRVKNADEILAPATLQLIREKNRLTRRAQRLLDDNPLKTMYKSLLKQVKHLVKQSVNKDRNQRWAQHIRNSEKSPTKFWAVTRRIRRGRAGVPPIKVNNEMIVDNQRKANEFAKMFAAAHALFVRPQNQFDKATEKRHLEVLDTMANGPAEFIDGAEIMAIIGTRKMKVACGCDGVSNLMLKKLPPSALHTLANIFNTAYRLGHWPSPFKRAVVIPLLKQGKSTMQVDSYRPISLLPAVAKIFERAVLVEINKHAEEANVIPDHQFGFRAAHSAAQQATHLSAVITNAKRNHRSCAMISLDIRKAYDSVWHAGLTAKLERYQFPHHLVRLIASFCTLRSFAVRVGGASSNHFPIPAGVPQGSGLSPVLYAIYTADIKVGRQCKILTFADDTIISVNALQHRTITKRLEVALTAISRYFNKWHISLNPSKTVFFIAPVDRKRKRLPPEPLSVGETTIHLANKLKYLGVTFDACMTFKSHANELRQKALNIGRALFPIFAGNNLSHPNR